MYYPDNSTAASSLPSPSAVFNALASWFSNGDPATGTPATVVDQDWLNGVTGELISIIQAAGLSPAKGTNNQAITAIKELIQQQTGNYALDTGAANAYAIALNPAVAALGAAQDGLTVRVKIVHANTGAATLAVNGLAPVAWVREDGTALQSGDLPAASIASATFDHVTNSFFMVGSPVFNSSVLGALAFLGAGQGLEADGAGGARVKLPDASLKRSAAGIQVNEAITALAVNTTLNAATHHLANIVATAALTLTLPKASTAGMMAFAALAQGGAVTLAPNAADAVQGGAAGTSFVIPAGMGVFAVTDGASSGNWWLLFAGASPWIASIWSAQQSCAVATLVDGTTINWALANAQMAQVTIAASRTLTNPTGQVSGTRYELAVNHGAGSTVLSFGSAYKGLTGLTFSTGSGAIDVLTFRSDGTYMWLIGRALNVAA